MKFPIKHAHALSDIPNAFSPRPLSTDEELRDFYFEDTMPVRTGDPYVSPIEDIIDACEMPSESGNTFLLLGHKGCGKSTELNKMSQRLRRSGFLVRTVQCGTDLDLMSPAYPDLLVLMGEALLEMAKEAGCVPDARAEATIREFWGDVEYERTVTQRTGAGVEAGIEAKRSVLKVPILDLFAKAAADLKYNVETRNVYREQVQRRLSDWRAAMSSIANAVTAAMDWKEPVILFEDLDKLDPKEAWEVFQNAEKLTGFTFPVIYTFPIALSYDPKFGSLRDTFSVKTFPMIKLTDVEGVRYDEGYRTIRRIVYRRADEDLFDDDALTRLIEKTGGSLRDLFAAINACSRRARRRGSERIGREDADRALEELRSSLTRRIEGRHYPFLEKILAGQRTNIPDQEMLLEMLQAGTVLEYNGERWHDVHPLVAEYLDDLRTKGLIGPDRPERE